MKVKVKKWVGFVDRIQSPCSLWPLQDRISRMALGWRVIVAWNRWAEKMDLFLLTYQRVTLPTKTCGTVVPTDHLVTYLGR